MVGLAAAVALLDRFSDLLAHGAVPLAIGFLPCQTILRARRADDALRILIYVVPLTRLKCVRMLRFDIAAGDRNGVELIGADASVEDLLLAGRGIERPLRPPLDDRDREWPVVVTHEKKRASTGLWVDRDPVPFLRLGGELGSALSILRTFTRQHDGLELGPEHLLERIQVVLRSRVDDGIAGLVGRIKCPDVSRRSNGSRGPYWILCPRLESDGCQAQTDHCADERCFHGRAPLASPLLTGHRRPPPRAPPPKPPPPKPLPPPPKPPPPKLDAPRLPLSRALPPLNRSAPPPKAPPPLPRERSLLPMRSPPPKPPRSPKLPPPARSPRPPAPPRSPRPPVPTAPLRPLPP